MRVWTLVAIVVMPGCVSDLLGPPEVTTRTVTCAVLAPDMQVRVVQHAPSDAVPAEVRDAAVQAWMQEMVGVTGKTDDDFVSDAAEGPDHDGPWDMQALRPWLRGQRVLETGQVYLRVLWVDLLPEQRAVEPLSPGVVLINTTAWTLAVTVGHDGQALARGLLYHGLGHALGVVNRGVPIQQAGGASREEPQHHEPGGVMSAQWHHLPLPRNATGYSEALVADWRHAQTSQAVCA